MSDNPVKPRYGEPCNGCGMCCRLELCAIAVEVAGPKEGPCEFLLWEGGRAWCGVVVAEKSQGKVPLIAEALGIGLGCCSDDPLPIALKENGTDQFT